jgi:hypothetical protein
MIEQTSTSVKFLAFYTSSKQGKTGLTVTIDIYDPSGTQIVTGGSATAIGGGLYSYTLSSNNSTEGEYAAIFKTSDSTVDAQHIPSLWVLGRAGVENLDAPVSSRSTLTAAQVNAEADTALSDVGLTTTITGRIDAAISSRLATSGYTAPSAAPSVEAIRQEMDANSTKLANLDATISSRLADVDYVSPTTPPTAAEIATAVEGSLLNESDGQAVLNAIVGAIGNSNVDEIALVAAIRSDLERSGGKLDSIPTTTAPTAAANASAVWAAGSRTLTSASGPTAAENASAVWSAGTRTLTSASGPTAAEIRQEIDANSAKLDASISSRLAASAYTAPSAAPTAAANAAAVRSELSVELGRLDQAISTRATPANIPTADIASIKAVTDDLDPERLANCATTNIVGTLLSQAMS